jgi:hypothetical protein
VIRIALALSSALYFSAALDPCELGPPGSDGGSSSGAGSSSGGGSSSGSGSQTIGVQCNAIVEEFCMQAIARCALAGFTVSDCVSNDLPQCCSAGNTCDQPSSQPASSVDTCKSDIDAVDCNFIANSTLPSSCQVLLHP